MSQRPFALLVYGSEVSIPVLHRGWRTPLLHYVVAHASRLLCISSYTESRTRALLGSRCPPSTVVGCGLDPAYWAEVPASAGLEPDPYLLSVGKLSVRKGFEPLIDAFARSGWSRRGSLAIVGGAQHWERIRSKARQAGLSERVRFLRDVTESELAALYRDASGFVLLNDEVDGDYEGLGIVFLEAALHALPLVGGIRGGVRDLIEHERTGLLVDPGDSAAIVDALDRILVDPDGAREMGRNARRKIFEEFTWDGVARKVVSELLDGRPRASDEAPRSSAVASG